MSNGYQGWELVQDQDWGVGSSPGQEIVEQCARCCQWGEKLIHSLHKDESQG